MIIYKEGNIFDAHTDAIINTVNLVGVMGKGIALQFKKRFPENFELYKRAIEDNEIDIGKLFITHTPNLFFKYIINFPTKKHWKNPSQYEYVEKGMQDLIQKIKELKIKSVAIPPLGAGNGKLEWERVKLIIEKYVSQLPDVEFLIYEPQKKFEDINQVKNPKAHLTEHRALLLGAFYAYDDGSDSLTLLAAQKIAYFFQRLKQPLRLKYEKGWYGPYAHNLHKVLEVLNGKYISFRTENVKPNNVVHLNYERKEEVINYIDNLEEDQKIAYYKLLAFIKGFETPFSLELLGSVDWVLTEDASLTSAEVLEDIQQWTKRKKKLMKQNHIEVAYQHLMEYKKELNY